MKDTKSFKRHEFLCPHCKKEQMHQEFIDWLQKLSDSVGNAPMIINSGYRCATHSVAVGGYATDAHVEGWAADIKCLHTAFRHQLITNAIKLGCVRIGVGKTFLHLDLSPTLPQQHIWVY